MIADGTVAGGDRLRCRPAPVEGCQGRGVGSRAGACPVDDEAARRREPPSQEHTEVFLFRKDRKRVFRALKSGVRRKDMKEIIAFVQNYGGTISAETGDGMITLTFRLPRRSP